MDLLFIEYQRENVSFSMAYKVFQRINLDLILL
jgi:hypothetical protein